MIRKSVNVPPIHTLELENWIWKTHKIRIRGGEPSKLRLSTPYYLSKSDVDRFLAAFDQFLKLKGAA
jgi:isopenicillin-N epimerase